MVTVGEVIGACFYSFIVVCVLFTVYYLIALHLAYTKETDELEKFNENENLHIHIGSYMCFPLIVVTANENNTKDFDLL